MRGTGWFWKVFAQSSLVAAISIGAVEGYANGGIPERAATDQYSWLEGRTDPRALQWVKTQNARTLSRLKSDPRFSRYYDAALEAVFDKNRLPGRDIEGWFHDDWVYAVWTDETHPRGLLRRTSLESFGTSDPTWELLLDVDALARREGKPYLLGPGRCFRSHCMLSILDAESTGPLIWREFDVERRQFVEGGFSVLTQLMPIFKDEDTLLVAADFGPESLTSAGQPLYVKEWIRGQPLASAKSIFEAEDSDSTEYVAPVELTDGMERRFYIQELSASGKSKYWSGVEQSELKALELPPDSDLIALHQGRWIVKLRNDWLIDNVTRRSGSLISIQEAESARTRNIQVIMEPGPRETVDGATGTPSGLLVVTHENVRGRLLHFVLEDGQWIRHNIPVPDFGHVDFAMHDPAGNSRFVKYESFLQPTTYYTVDLSNNRLVPLVRAEAQFDANRYVTEQFEAKSRDGTRVPYFVVRPKSLHHNSKNPTLLSAYGGNGTPQYPRYDGVLGRLWLDQGGIYVLANIRGGGEFGPRWHQAAVKTKRHRAYEDFVAVAEDLIRRKVTGPDHLGMSGFSNGGGLVGVMLNQCPELFNAAVAENGVFDMIRNDLQNASVIVREERGSPDVPEERAFLERTSPYQNLQPRARMPMPLIGTSTTDTTVFPAMPRKFAAKMEGLHLPFYFYEAPQGGHAMYATPQQRALWEGMKFTYLAQRLIGSGRKT